MPEFEVLPGLPPYGPLPEQFSDSGLGTHRQGLVVRFESPEGHRWVGNFQRGDERFDAALRHPDGAHVVIVAGGAVYVVDPATRRSVEPFSLSVVQVVEPEGSGLLVLASCTDVLALKADGVAWKTGRVALDGIRNLRVEGQKLVGEGWWGSGDDAWSRFEIDLTDGTVRGQCWESS